MAVSKSLNVPVRSHLVSSPSIDKVKLIVALKSSLCTVTLSLWEFSTSFAFSAVGELVCWVEGIVSWYVCTDGVWRAAFLVRTFLEAKFAFRPEPFFCFNDLFLEAFFVWCGFLGISC